VEAARTATAGGEEEADGGGEGEGGMADDWDRGTPANTCTYGWGQVPSGKVADPNHLVAGPGDRWSADRCPTENGEKTYRTCRYLAM
jgi:hypothetical protein